MRTIIIIGAGLAGAAAALRLSKAGFETLVLEAQGRVGGRALSRVYNGNGCSVTLEFGGAWITKYHQKVREFAAEFGLTLRPRAAITSRLAMCGNELKPMRFDTDDERRTHERCLGRISADSALCKMGHRENECGHILHGISFGAYLDRIAPSQTTRHMLEAWWTVSGNGGHYEVEASEFLASCAYGGGLAENMIEAWSDTIEPGMSVLVERMFAKSKANLQLNCLVSHVRQESRQIIVETRSGEVFRSSNAIIATGINPLRSISFDPPLPSPCVAATQRGHGGKAFKLWIHARGIAVGTLITGTGRGIELLFAERANADGTVLIVGFGLQLHDADPGNIDWVRSELTRIVPNAEFLSCDWHDWVEDPFSLGAWVSIPVGMGEAFHSHSWRPQGRIAFATSDHAPDQAGWFEGAIKSGEDAADWVVKQLSP